MDGWLRKYEGGPIEEVELECVRCGHTWHADGHREYGAWMPESENDLYCPKCGVEGEE
jgi:Zn finger protein HypA/HybF involved in hydrogenase expression